MDPVFIIIIIVVFFVIIMGLSCINRRKDSCYDESSHSPSHSPSVKKRVIQKPQYILKDESCSESEHTSEHDSCEDEDINSSTTEKEIERNISEEIQSTKTTQDITHSTDEESNILIVGDEIYMPSNILPSDTCKSSLVDDKSLTTHQDTLSVSKENTSNDKTDTSTKETSFDENNTIKILLPIPHLLSEKTHNS